MILYVPLLIVCLRGQARSPDAVIPLLPSVASLGKDQPFPARRALQLTPSRHAESAIHSDAVH